MDIFTLSNIAIERELGARLRGLRLRKNLTQQQLAEATQLSMGVIKALESGHCKLSSIIAVLRALNALDTLDQFIPPQTVSPIQLAALQGKMRERASGRRGRRNRSEPT